jgi:DNA (cytosine-5)-methyltransferase 1
MAVKNYIRIKDIMEQLDCSQRIVERWIASGQLKSEKINGVHQITQKELKIFIAEQEKINLGKTKRLVGKTLFGEDFDYLNTPKKSSKQKQDDINWVDISNAWEKPGNSKLTSVDLFCGAGGITKGFELAGFNNICGLDWFKEAGMTYRKNFNHAHVEGDISSPDKKQELYDKVRKGLKGKTLNVIAGGFPCQGFSMSGNRVVDDPRNSLYREMLEIVNELQPEFVVMENVKGLRSMLKGKVEQKIIEDYQAAGYEVNVTILMAANYSTPQKRERIIFICNRVGKKNFHPEPFLNPAEFVTTREAIQDIMDLEDSVEFNHVRTKHKPEMAERLLAIPEGKSLYANYSDSWKKCPWDEASCTIKENHGGVNVHPKRGRVLTAREMARIQSFPDDFIFEGPKSKQLIQLGNAVPPYLAKAIGLAIRKSYDEI